MKTILLLLVTATLALGADIPAASCCTKQAGGKKDNCCTAVDAITFSRNSLYQAEAAFTNDAGRPFTLGELRGRTVVLMMFFASCGYACPLLVTDLEIIRGRLTTEQRNRTMFVLVSFDTVRDTPESLAKYRALRGLDDSWVLLHGSDDSVRELAALLGVRYQRGADGMFSHSNLITILNAQGEIAHQRTGLKGGLDEAVSALVAATRN